MEQIRLDKILPEVFAGRSDFQSDVWLKDIVFQKGKTYLIEANSGTGKSSLCSFLYGYRSDYRGSIYFDDTNVRELKIRDWVKIRKKSLALLWQELRLFPELTAMENVLIKNRLAAPQSKKQIETWFERLRIDDKSNEKVAHLSYGQQQRVAFVRALCQPSDFILLDEPISHLDDSNAQTMAEILLEETRNRGAGLIATSIGKTFQMPFDVTLHL